MAALGAIAAALVAPMVVKAATVGQQSGARHVERLAGDGKLISETCGMMSGFSGPGHALA